MQHIVDTGEELAVHLMTADEPMPTTGHIYRKSLLAGMLQEVSPVVQRRGMYGMLDHDMSGVIRMQLISHVVTSLDLFGDEVWASIEILDTPSGRILRKLRASGVPVVFACLGRGKLSPGAWVQTCSLITVNAIHDDGHTRLRNVPASAMKRCAESVRRRFEAVD